MRHILVLMIGLGSVLGCAASAKSDEADEIVARFQRLADAGQLEELRLAFPLDGFNLNGYITQQNALGKRIHSTRAAVEDLRSGSVRQISLFHNSEFERGRAFEVFQFLIHDDGAPVLKTYSSTVGKEFQCPWLFASPGRCELVAAP